MIVQRPNHARAAQAALPLQVGQGSQQARGQTEPRRGAGDNCRAIATLPQEYTVVAILVLISNPSKEKVSNKVSHLKFTLFACIQHSGCPHPMFPEEATYGLIVQYEQFI